MANAPFQLPIRVYYQDTDAGGVVFHGTYLNFLERARIEWLRSLGYDVRELNEKEGLIFALRSMQIEYLKPARLDDLLQVTSAVAQLGGSSVRCHQQVWRDEDLLVEAQVGLVCVDLIKFRPIRIPETVRAHLTTQIEVE